MKTAQPANNDWYKLDTSAKIYPAIVSDRQTTMFRISFTLRNEIDPDILQKALENSFSRFPYYNVSLRYGLFWNYLELNNRIPSVYCDTPSPCENIDKIYYDGFLYKILFYKSRIAIEFSHVMSDGYGALEFAKAIIFEYLRLAGFSVENDGSVFDLDSPMDPGEVSDDHIRYTGLYPMDNKKDKERNLFGGVKAFHIKGRLIPPGKYNIVTGIIPVADLKKISREHNSTITELLTAIYMEALIDIQRKQIRKADNYKSIAVQVPVNMRNLLESKSMKNFALFVTPTLDPPDFPDFDALLDFVRTYIRENNRIEPLMKIMRDNVSVGENDFVRHLPLVFKLPVVRFIANTRGSTQHSGTLSNLGLIKLPPSMAEQVEDIICILGPDPHSKTTCGLVGYKDSLYLTFGSLVRGADLEKRFFRRLVKMGAHIKLQSNY